MTTWWRRRGAGLWVPKAYAHVDPGAFDGEK